MAASRSRYARYAAHNVLHPMEIRVDNLNAAEIENLAMMVLRGDGMTQAERKQASWLIRLARPEELPSKRESVQTTVRKKWWDKEDWYEYIEVQVFNFKGGDQVDVMITPRGPQKD